jgi:hypothetical protein
MNSEDIILLIKQLTSATDDELTQAAIEVKRRYGLVISTEEFLYYRVAIDCYHLQLPEFRELEKLFVQRNDISYQ